MPAGTLHRELPPVSPFDHVFDRIGEDSETPETHERPATAGFFHAQPTKRNQMNETFTVTYASGKTRTYQAPGMAAARAIAREWLEDGDELMRIEGELGRMERVPDGRWAVYVFRPVA